jgi:type IV pilus assembly protein PilV
MNKSHRPYTGNSGIALIEVLITIVVIAFGLLGLLTLQTKTMLSATQTNQYYVATMSAQDMGERIRANAENYLNYDMNSFGRGGAGCAGVCAIDIADWHDNIAGPEGATITANAIAGAEGQIVIANTAAGPTANISVRWTEQDSADPYTYTLQVPINANVR